jgi:hypothetical protein
MILPQSHSSLEGLRPYPLQGPFTGWWLVTYEKVHWSKVCPGLVEMIEGIWMKAFLLLIPYPSDLPAHGPMEYGSVINNSSVSRLRDSLLINILSVGLSDRLINCLSLDRGDLWGGRISQGKDPREPLSPSPILLTKPNMISWLLFLTYLDSTLRYTLSNVSTSKPQQGSPPNNQQ